MEILSLEEENIIEDIRNLYILKKKIQENLDKKKKLKKLKIGY